LNKERKNTDSLVHIGKVCFHTRLSKCTLIFVDIRLYKFGVSTIFNVFERSHSHFLPKLHLFDQNYIKTIIF